MSEGNNPETPSTMKIATLLLTIALLFSYDGGGWSEVQSVQRAQVTLSN